MALALALRLVPAPSLALALRLTGPGSSPSSIALALALLLARLDMLLWNQVALWRHAAGARTITGYPFGPTNLPVNAFGPWPGGTSWTPPAETACVLPWLGRRSVIPSRGRGVGPPLHEATHLLHQQQRTGVIARAAHLIGPCSAPSWDASMPKILRCHHASPIFQPARPMGARAWRPVSA